MSKKIGITEQREWDEKWPSIFEHYQQDLRNAYYVNAAMDSSDNKILEIAAGSFRDMAQLNRLGLNCYGTDYSEKAVEMAKQFFPQLEKKIFQSDAFSYKKIPDEHFDVSYHNGFWILYEDDAKLIELAKEQARITKNKIIVTVHNAHNQQFIEYFRKLAENDSLYKIRFFEVDEIIQIMQKVCASVKIIPVGKGKKFHEDALINQGKHSRKELNEFLTKAKFDNLENSERLMCIGYI